MKQFIIFASYCLLIFLVNLLFYKNKKKKNNFYEALGGFLYLIAIIGSIAVTFYLVHKGQISAPMWPSRVWYSIGALFALYLFARVEMVYSIITEHRDLKQSVATFLGPLGIHFSSLLVSIGIIFPYLQTVMSLPLAIFLSALTFPAYHFCQFYFFSEGKTAKFQFQIFAYALTYVIFYQISHSFIMTFILQHLVATTTFIYNKDYDFGERDFPFYLGIITVAISIIYTIIWLK